MSELFPMDGLVEKSRKSIPIREGDYTGPDGLLYCGNCHTPKQTRKEVGGRIIMPMILCQCGAKEYEREREEDARKMREAEITRNRSVAFPSGDMKNMRFELDDGSNPELTELAKSYVAKFGSPKLKGRGLLLYGPVGTGKSFAAGCIANALLDQGYTVTMTDFPRVANGYMDAKGKNEYLDDLNKVDLLILDDLGVERNTDFMQETVQTVVNARYMAKKPFIITTNMTGQELNDPSGGNRQRYLDRLKEMCFHYKVQGQSRRRKAFRQNQEEMARLLGVKDSK